MAAKSNTGTKLDSATKALLSSHATGAESRSDIKGLIHERTRLAIVSALAVTKEMTFNDLKAALQISDGNLSSHARKLEDAGYITCKKDFDGRLPRTKYSLTASGRKALKSYVSHMESLIKAIKKA